MSGECKIGSLPWFAGLWWFVIGCAFHAAAWATFYARDGITALTHWLINQAGASFARSQACAGEGVER